MKFFIYSLLVCTVYAATVIKRSPQSSSGGLSGLLGSMGSKPANIQVVKPRIRLTARRELIRYGPIKLAASKDGGASAGEHGHGGKSSSSLASFFWGDGGKGLAMDPNGTPFSKLLSEGYCTDCTVLAAQIDIVFENSTRADISNGVYLHHMTAAVMGNSTGKQSGSWVDMCPKGANSGSTSGLASLLSNVDLGSLAGGAFVGGAVDEFIDYFTSPDGKVNSGYFIPANNRMFVSGEVINYLKTPQEVYIRLDLEWVPGKQGVDAIKTPINVEGCDFSHAAFKNAKADKGVIKSADFTVTRNVTVLCQRAHMHDGGDSVTAFVNDKKICTSKASYGSAGAHTVVNGKIWTTISKMSDCVEPLKLEKGDKIRLEAAYDNVAHPLRVSHGEAQGNMAFMTFTVTY